MNLYEIFSAINTDPSVDNEMYLRNGKVVFPANGPTGINDGEASGGNAPVQLFNDAQSHGSSDAAVGNSDDDLRAALSALMIQNKC